jgi:hypothetical protein
MSLPHKLVPEQTQGIKKDLKADIVAHDTDEADELFVLAKDRLLNLNNWKETSASASATFQLTDKQGNELSRPAHTGDYIRIKIPAPGTDAGDGYDWVHIEAIEYDDYPDEEMETIAMRVRPASAPVNSNDATAHFFTAEATSTFVIERRGRHLIAHYYGRNEKANTESKLLDNARNVAISVGAWLGGSDLQWESLLQGWLQRG